VLTVSLSQPRMQRGTTAIHQFVTMGCAAMAAASRVRVSALCTGPRMAAARASRSAARAASASPASVRAKAGVACLIRPSIGAKAGVAPPPPRAACAASTSGKRAQALKTTKRIRTARSMAHFQVITDCANLIAGPAAGQAFLPFGFILAQIPKTGRRRVTDA
jgi:hypothetical protein